MRTELVRDELEQVLWSRELPPRLVHHSNRGSQYLSNRYSERLAEVAVQLPVGSVRDPDANAPVETVMGIFDGGGPLRGLWKTLAAVRYAMLEWVDGFRPTSGATR
jgi:putative transposase